MRKSYILTITVPDGQAVVPQSVAVVLRAAADFMEWQQSDNEPRIIAGPPAPGCPMWKLERQRS